MVHATPMQFLSDTSATLVRAFSSLTRRDAAAVRATVRSAGGGFAIEELDDYDGYLSLMLTPEQESGAAYLVSGRTGAVDLAALQGDDLVPLGSGYASIGAAMLVLRPLLERGHTTGSATDQAQQFVARFGPDAALHAAIGADAAAPKAKNGWTRILRAIDALGGRR